MAQYPILQTKLHVPPVRPELVSRPRLIGRLNDGLSAGCKLTLISAPAGFGKTMLLSEWTRQSGLPVAWVSLDAGDNDPARFWAYFVAALQTIHQEIGTAMLAMLHSPQPPPVETLLTALINEIAQVPGPLALVIDDLHMIAGQPVHGALACFLDNLPPQMHLFLAGRADPPLPLARLRARREMTELHAADLRFTSEEATTFLNEVMKLDLSAEDVAALEERTEGWIAGLQMTGLSMAGRQDLPRFIKTFSGSHRFILDYLVEEVLDRQPRDVQEFLFSTSILEQMTAPLCDAVTGIDSSQTILAQLEQANLFLVPLDDERRWYRYHHLFADLLRNHLEQTRPDQVPALHRRAAEWYESKGQIVEAVGHALATGDVEQIERLVAENALAVIYHGELATVARWLGALPDEVMRSRPRLCVAHAWALAYGGRLDGVEPLLQDAEKALVRRGAHSGTPILSIAQGRQIAGHIAAIRAYVAALKEDAACSVELARTALRLLPEADLTVRCWTALVLGCVLRSQGDPAAAADVFAEALAISQAVDDSYLGIDVLWEQAVLQSWQGQLHKVMNTCEEALQLASRYAGRGGWQLPVTGYTYSLMSDVLCEWNELETALRYAREGLTLCKRWGQADALAQGYFYLAKALQAVGETDSALDAIQEARQTARRLGSWYAVTAGAYEAGIRLAQGDVAAATWWVQESGPKISGELSIEYCISYAILARILMAEGRLGESLEFLARLLKMVEAAGAVKSAIGILALQSLILQAQGKNDQAMAALERALSLAEPEGYVRVFAGEGGAMGGLLRQAAGRGIRPDYVRRLLAVLESGIIDERHPLPLALSLAVEPLSERELEILRYLATPLPTTGIAEEVVVSASTVRSHVKRIYHKLKVHKRTEAVRRAQGLGLL